MSFYGWDPAAGPTRDEARREAAVQAAAELTFSGQDLWEAIAWDKDDGKSLEDILELASEASHAKVGRLLCELVERVTDKLREKHARGVR